MTGPRGTWHADVDERNAQWLATECRTARPTHVLSINAAAEQGEDRQVGRLAGEYRPRDLGDGQVELSALALGALQELGEEEDGFITDDGEGLQIWVADDAFELQRTDP